MARHTVWDLLINQHYVEATLFGALSNWTILLAPPAFRKVLHNPEQTTEAGSNGLKDHLVTIQAHSTMPIVIVWKPHSLYKRIARCQCLSYANANAKAPRRSLRFQKLYRWLLGYKFLGRKIGIEFLKSLWGAIRSNKLSISSSIFRYPVWVVYKKFKRNESVKIHLITHVFSCNTLCSS